MKGDAMPSPTELDQLTNRPLQLILMATGTEVSLCVAAHERLAAEGPAAS